MPINRGVATVVRTLASGTLRRTRRTAATAALLAAAAGAACGRGAASADPSLTPQTCAGEWQVVVTSERNRRILVIEQGPTVRRTVIGEVLGRTSNAWAVNPAVGVYYTAVDAETGELYAAESRHPRGYTARQVRIVRQCVIQTEPDTTAPGTASRR